MAAIDRARTPAEFALVAVLVSCTAPGLPPSRHPGLECRPGRASARDDSNRRVEVPRAGARATVLDFWARWCATCRSKLPLMLARRQDLAAQGIDLVLVGVIEPRGSIAENRAALEAWGMPARFIADWRGALAQRYGIDALPAAVVLDRQGAIRWITPVKGFDPDAITAAATLAATHPCSGP